MVYTDADFKRMESDPTLARQYFWQCFQRWKLDGLAVGVALDWLRDVSDETLLAIAKPKMIKPEEPSE